MTAVIRKLYIKGQIFFRHWHYTYAKIICLKLFRADTPPITRLDLTQLLQHGPGAALEALSSSALALNSFVLKQKPQAQKLKERIVFLRPHTKKATEIPHRNCAVLNCRTGLPNYSKLSSEQHLCQKQNSELI